MDFDLLRTILAVPIIGLKDLGTHAMLPQLCAELGLPPLPDEGSKAQRLASSFNAVQDHELPGIAEKFLAVRQPAAKHRNEIQDVLWSSCGSPEINKRVRRDVARSIDTTDLYLNVQGFDRLLEKLWILDEHEWTGPFAPSIGGLRQQIEKHVHRNSGDWSTELLFEKLGAWEANSRRFALFLEGLASADVRPDDAEQRRFVASVNVPLVTCGLQLQETSTHDGYAVFTLVLKHGSPIGKPKNLIFASPIKPDLRFRDAVNNDIEIVTNADKVLVFDRPIGSDGLRWCDLQAWWSASKNLADSAEAKTALYARLRQSLPSNSPPQALLFDAYHRSFGSSIPALPALLPEVWLHWDARTVRERGTSALSRFRMDFLLLLPHGVRVVVEVDGKQHYSDVNGRADAGAYAKMVQADRDLQLSGYHVFRFGGAELSGPDGRELVKDFFNRLFARFGVASAR